MTLDSNAVSESILLVEVIGGNDPSPRRTHSQLKVPQSQLSPTLKRIHRLGGKILRVERIGAPIDRSLTPAEPAIEPSEPTDRLASEPLPVASNDEDRELAADRLPEEPQRTSSIAIEREARPSPVAYPSFPRGKINPSNLSPVRRKARQTSRRSTRLRFTLRDRQLSEGKERRKFFRTQSSRIRRRR